MALEKIRKPRAFGLSAGDKIALVALALSLVNFGWWAWGEWLGPELKLAKISGHVIELRCVSGKDACWRPDETGKRPGRTVAIAPVFATNFAAPGQNEVIRHARVSVNLPDLNRDLEMWALANWGATSAGGRNGDMGPFIPILVAGRSVGGSEVRFTPFDRQHRLPWAQLADAIIEGQIQKIGIQLTVNPVLEPQEQTVECIANISDQARDTLAARRDSGGSPYFSFVCT